MRIYFNLIKFRQGPHQNLIYYLIKLIEKSSFLIYNTPNLKWRIRPAQNEGQESKMTTASVYNLCIPPLLHSASKP